VYLQKMLKSFASLAFALLPFRSAAQLQDIAGLQDLPCTHELYFFLVAAQAADYVTCLQTSQNPPVDCADKLLTLANGLGTLVHEPGCQKDLTSFLRKNVLDIDFSGFLQDGISFADCLKAINPASTPSQAEAARRSCWEQSRFGDGRAQAQLWAELLPDSSEADRALVRAAGDALAALGWCVASAPALQDTFDDPRAWAAFVDLLVLDRAEWQKSLNSTTSRLFPGHEQQAHALYGFLNIGFASPEQARNVAALLRDPRPCRQQYAGLEAASRDMYASPSALTAARDVAHLLRFAKPKQLQTLDAALTTDMNPDAVLQAYECVFAFGTMKSVQECYETSSAQFTRYMAQLHAKMGIPDGPSIDPSADPAVDPDSASSEPAPANRLAGLGILLLVGSLLLVLTSAGVLFLRWRHSSRTARMAAFEHAPLDDPLGETELDF